MYLVLHNSAIVNSGAVLEDGGNQFSAAPASLELGRNTTEAATTASPLAVQQINNFNFTVGICMVMKDAEAYFEEWVDYHVGVMKFDAIYIYDEFPRLRIAKLVPQFQKRSRLRQGGSDALQIQYEG